MWLGLSPRLFFLKDPCALPRSQGGREAWKWLSCHLIKFRAHEFAFVDVPPLGLRLAEQFRL